MRTILVSFLIGSIVVYFFFWSPMQRVHFHNIVDRNLVAAEVIHYEYGDMAAKMMQDADEGLVCRAIGENMGFNVKVDIGDLSNVPKEEGGYGVLGQWNSNTYTIHIDEKNITLDVIAHEVFHMAETVAEAKGLTDPHYRAYLQGYFTECVFNVVLVHKYGREFSTHHPLQNVK